MQTVHLFPKVIGLFDLNRDLTNSELTTINLNLDELLKNRENSISKNKYVLNDPSLLNLKQFMDNSLNEYLQNVLEENTQLRITQSWLNKITDGEHHHAHCHPNSYLSGVFYIKTDDDDKIMFFSNEPRNNYYEPEFKNWNMINAKSWWLPTPQNSLLIFNSDLFHSVPPQPHNNDRVSLSFNTFPIGNLGTDTNATYLPLSR